MVQGDPIALFLQPAPGAEKPIRFSRVRESAALILRESAENQREWGLGAMTSSPVLLPLFVSHRAA